MAILMKQLARRVSGDWLRTDAMESWVLEKIRRAKAEEWKRLELGNAGLEELPDELFELTKLQTLLLGSNYWDSATGDWVKSENPGPENSFKVVPAQISRLTNLTELDLTSTPITSAEPLAALTKLTRLDLSHCRLTCFPRVLLELPLLSLLQMYGNPIADCPVTHIRMRQG
jgi:Leucine-rich repeat (LRR) protein